MIGDIYKTSSGSLLEVLYVDGKTVTYVVKSSGIRCTVGVDVWNRDLRFYQIVKYGKEKV